MSTIFEVLEQEGIQTRMDPLLSLQRMRHHPTSVHADHVAAMVGALVDRMSIPQREAQWIDLAARLHDLGTIGIPDLILHKGADLTLTERQIMQAHPESAYDALCEVRDFREVAAIVLHHHERYDGSGYPHGLEGKAIPLGSRIIAVLDAFDAMTSERPHRRPRAEREACEELLIGKGGQFDADIVDAFLETLRFGVH